MASTEVEPRMADNMPASLANARILDEIMNDGDEEAVRQLEIDIHEEVCMMFLHICFVVAEFPQGCKSPDTATCISPATITLRRQNRESGSKHGGCKQH